jgi:predicted nucleotidyltransferase
MTVLAIIAEYDPFHNGHLYHLKESLMRTGAEASVVVMSGCFTQRGLPAMLDKRLRARAAVECGADLVIELPFVYAAGGAELFAKGAVRILNGLNVADALSFGSESGDLDGLSRVASLLADDSAGLNASIREGLKQGVSYPAARERAVAESLGREVAGLMRSPNNILAIEYLKELKLTASRMTPVSVKREGAGEGDANEASGMAGATAIRQMFKELYRAGAGDVSSSGERDVAPGADPFGYLPEPAARVVREHIGSGGALVFADALFPHLVRTVIDEGSAVSLRAPMSEMLSAAEGLENRLVKAVRRARGMDEAVRFAGTRRYTETRVRRLILHSVTGLTKDAAAAAVAEPPYARVLAFSGRGAGLIRRAKKSGSVPVVTNAGRERDALAESPVTFSFDVRAAELYKLLGTGSIDGFNERSERPVNPFE